MIKHLILQLKKIVKKIKQNSFLIKIIKIVKKNKKKFQKKLNIEKSDSFSFFKNTFSLAKLFAILNAFSIMQQIYKLINF